MTTFGFNRVLDHTAKSCTFGCGMCTVLVDYGNGSLTRVHCGTYRAQCPQEPKARNQVTGPVHGTVEQFGDVTGGIRF